MHHQYPDNLLKICVYVCVSITLQLKYIYIIMSTNVRLVKKSNISVNWCLNLPLEGIDKRSSSDIVSIWSSEQIDTCKILTIRQKIFWYWQCFRMDWQTNNYKYWNRWKQTKFYFPSYSIYISGDLGSRLDTLDDIETEKNCPYPQIASLQWNGWWRISVYIVCYSGGTVHWENRTPNTQWQSKYCSVLH